jgi:hypothetical protein
MGRSRRTSKKTGSITPSHTSEVTLDSVDVKNTFANLCMLLKVHDIEAPNRIVSVKVNHHNIDEASLFKKGYSEIILLKKDIYLSLQKKRTITSHHQPKKFPQ